MLLILTKKLISGGILMKIGIDLDGVVLDTEKQFRNDAELYERSNRIKSSRKI